MTIAIPTRRLNSRPPPPLLLFYPLPKQPGQNLGRHPVLLPLSLSTHIYCPSSISTVSQEAVSSLLSVPQTWHRFMSLSPFARLLQWLLNCHPFLLCGHSLIASCALPHTLGPSFKQATAVAISFSPPLHEGFSQAVCLVPTREPCTDVHPMRPGRVRNLLHLLTVRGGSS